MAIKRKSLLNGNTGVGTGEKKFEEYCNAIGQKSAATPARTSKPRAITVLPEDRKKLVLLRRYIEDMTGGEVSPSVSTLYRVALHAAHADEKFLKFYHSLSR